MMKILLTRHCFWEGELLHCVHRFQRIQGTVPPWQKQEDKEDTDDDDDDDHDDDDDDSGQGTILTKTGGHGGYWWCKATRVANENENENETACARTFSLLNTASSMLSPAPEEFRKLQTFQQQK